MASMTTERITDQTGRHIVKATYLDDDGAGLSDQVLFDSSAFVNPITGVLGKVTKIFTTITSGKSITLEWDGSTDVPIGTFNGNVTWNLHAAATNIPNTVSSGATGDILVTTNSFVSGDSFTIIVEVRD